MSVDQTSTDPKPVPRIPSTGDPLIYLITAGEMTAEGFSVQSGGGLELIHAAVASGADLVQIREKQLTGKQLFELTCEAANVVRGSSTKLLLNDRADIALAAGADGVHLTAASVPCRVIRQAFPKGFIIGVSTHSREEVVSAGEQGADFVTFGPVFETPSKIRYGAPQGLSKLAEAASAVDIPVIALGGIDATNFPDALRAGANGLAAIRLFSDPATLPDIVRIIRNRS